MSGAVVVGGGIVGRAIAWRLAGDGVAVTVVDPGDDAGRATPAAGGMLSPLAEAHAPGPFLDLGLASLRLYGDFVAAVERATGRRVGYDVTGKLVVATSAAEEEALHETFGWQIDEGYEVEALSGARARALEPALAPAVRAAMRLGDDHRVDNVALERAVAEAGAAEGVRDRRGRVAEVVTGERGVAGVRLEDGAVLEADAVIVAAGAWSGRLGGLSRALPVEPVRGQMLALRPAAPLFRHTIGGPRGYLVPRPDGRVVVGATEEHAGFEVSTTREGLAALRDAATSLVPALANAPAAGSWAGLRPGTPDHLPILGADPDVPGLIYATGHFRNGILLTPVTAEIVAALVAGTEPPVELEPFRVARFGDAGPAAKPGAVRPSARREVAADDRRAARGDPAAATSPICDVCGGPMLEVHCKLVCERCGYKRDCSDP